MKHLLLIILGVALLVSVVRGQGTAFTYNGRLSENGSPASGTYDFRFTLYSGQTQPLDQTFTGVPVTSGLFTLTLNFGQEIFDGGPLDLGVEVRTNGVAGPYAQLSLRQPILSAPYAIRSLVSGLADS